MKLISIALIISLKLMTLQAQHNPHWINGRNTIVHLFEWKWLDIADECERFLAPKGYAGVQISPPSENIILKNQWWERYQPVSYKLDTRSGNQKEFAKMCQRCNAVGVRIYPDAVINHMAAVHGYGSGGSLSEFNLLSFPAIPYSRTDFNRDCGINDFNNPMEVRNCRLTGLPDLNQGNEWVRSRIADYLNLLIDLGVAGFRVDAVKHMWPGDLENIFNRLHNLNTSHGFAENSRPFIYQEVIDMGWEGVSKYEYTKLGVVTEFRYSLEIGRAFGGNNQLKWLRTFGPQWGFLESPLALTFVDNHDNQRSGHGSGNNGILTHKNSKPYKMATAFHLAWPYGISQIMSSFAFESSDQGPPSSSPGHTISPQFNSEGACINGWICEHRWRQIYNMVKFKNVAGNENVENWWDNWNNQIAFSRGKKCFIAFNLEPYTMNVTLYTSLPSGNYCDIVSGNKIENRCTGKSINVDNNGNANIYIANNEEDGFVAFHVESKL